MKRNVAIVHYNTPELTEATILSLRKHSGEDYQVYVFDNSDARPFVKPMPGVTVIDNTRAQCIDFAKELEKYPNRSFKQGCVRGGEFGSAKHMMSVQYLMDNVLKDGFLLLDSDILIRADIDFMFMEDEFACGHVQTWQRSNNPAHIDRLVPMLLWINTPLCKAAGIRFFDPKRSFALMGGPYYNPANWYDTGASFLEDIRKNKPETHGWRIDIRPLMHHYQAGSWHRNNLNAQIMWLEKYADLWKPSKGYTLGGGVVKPPKEQDARIYICAHKGFRRPVTNPVYEVVDGRDGGDSLDGVPGSFFSELLMMHRVAQRDDLPSIVGFCGYRKYFVWMDMVPDLASVIRTHGCCVSEYLDLKRPMRTHYAACCNVEDLDIATGIIEKDHPLFAPAWHRALESHCLHPCSMFIMPAEHFRRMTALIMSIVSGYLQHIGGDIDKRVEENKRAYHIPRSTVAYQRRVGGQLCERIVSAWIDWQFPDAEQMQIKIIR